MSSTGLTGATKQQIEYQAWLKRVTAPDRDWSRPTGAVPGVDELMEEIRARAMVRIRFDKPHSGTLVPGSSSAREGCRATRQHSREQTRQTLAARQHSTQTFITMLISRASHIGTAAHELFYERASRLFSRPPQSREDPEQTLQDTPDNKYTPGPGC